MAGTSWDGRSKGRAAEVLAIEDYQHRTCIHRPGRNTTRAAGYRRISPNFCFERGQPVSSASATASRKRTRDDPNDEDRREFVEGTSVGEVEAVFEETYYDCPRCRSRLPVALTAFDDADARSRKIDAARVEHEDFHFAQSLSKQNVVVLGGKAGSSRSSKPSGSSNKKRKVDQKQGIGAYFNKT